MPEDAADVLIILSALAAAASIGLGSALWRFMISDREVPRGR